jgi:hypothetical protein
MLQRTSRFKLRRLGERKAGERDTSRQSGPAEHRQGLPS